MYNFDKLLDRRNTDCNKWDALEKNYGNANLMPFWVADMDFEVLPELKEALIKRASSTTYGYSYPNEQYYANIIRWYQKRHGLKVKQNEILNVPGVVTGFAFAIAALAPAGSKILINTPVYHHFMNSIQLQGFELVDSPLICEENGYYHIDFEDLERKLASGVKIYLMCSPHNPVCRVWTKYELQKITQLCEKYQVLIVSDEIHSDLVFKSHVHTPILMASDYAASHSVLIAAPSKTFNIAGISSSFMIVPNPELRTKINNILKAFHAGVNLFGFIASEAAYGYGEQWLNELNLYLEENAKFVCDYFKKHLPQVKVTPPEGTYLMWLDFSAFGLSQDELMEKLEKQAGVALNNGDMFQPAHPGYVRFNIGTPRFYIEKGLQKIVEAFAG